MRSFDPHLVDHLWIIWGHKVREDERLDGGCLRHAACVFRRRLVRKDAGLQGRRIRHTSDKTVDRRRVHRRPSTAARTGTASASAMSCSKRVSRKSTCSSRLTTTRTTTGASMTPRAASVMPRLLDGKTTIQCQGPEVARSASRPARARGRNKSPTVSPQCRQIRIPASEPSPCH